MSSPASKYTNDQKVAQAIVDQQSKSEPVFKTRIINELNKQCAKKKYGIFLRQMQPNPVCDCAMYDFKWTEEESIRFQTDGNLPRDLATIEQETKVVLMWIFDATGTGELLPELELNPVPDFQKYPALCVFDIDGKGKTYLIPSERLQIIPTVGNKVQFVLNE